MSDVYHDGYGPAPEPEPEPELPQADTQAEPLPADTYSDRY